MRILSLTLVSLLLLVPTDANAQYRGSRGGNHWSGHSGYYGNYHGFYGGYYGRGYHSPYWSFGIGGYYPGYYTTPNVTYYESIPRTSNYYEPATADSLMMSANSDRMARIEVRVQNADDILVVQNVPIPGMGLTRQLVSPELENGRSYTYTLAIRRANSTSSQDADKREIEVRAGTRSMVDFTQPAINKLPIPRSANP